MGYVIKNNRGETLCNFVPQIISLDEIHIENCKTVISIQMQLIFNDQTNSDTFTIEFTELSCVQWRNLDPRCWFNPNVSNAVIQRYLESAVRSGMDSAPQREVFQLNNTGVSVIDGKAVFCIGGKVVQPPSDIMSRKIITRQDIGKNLDIDINLSEGKAVSGIFDLVSLSPDPGRIILTYKILYLMRQAYIDAGAKPNFCIYLYGKTGTKKTTFSSFLTQMYNRRKGIESPPRLNASISAAVKILTEISDDTIVLDDLCPAESNQIRRQQEETLIEITRFIGDGTVPARVRGKELLSDSPKCGVIFTGEYIIGKGSDAARILPVEMMVPDGERLKFFQDHPLIVSTFYYFFIKWFIENYKNIVMLLKEWLINYRKVSLGVHDRLQEMHFFLNTAFAMLMQYGDDKNFLSHTDAIRLHSSFRNLLTRLVMQQDRRVQKKQTEASKVQNYLGHIRELYTSGQLTIASDTKQFDERQHDGLLHRNRLYLRGNRLLAYFPGLTIEDIADALDDQGALETGTKARTKQISSLNGMRFYVIPISRLN